MSPDIRLPGRRMSNRVVGVVAALFEGLLIFHGNGEIPGANLLQYSVFRWRSWETSPGLLHFSIPGYFS
jgi:hypothetical protein